MIVGFIGLGAMGLPMAKNVLEGGYDLVTTFNRRRGPADELASMGANVVDTAADVARRSDVVITVLPADRELEEVVQGEEGLLQGFREGATLIDMTTATPQVLQRLEPTLTAAGVQILDAPVSGGTPAAAEGTLTIMVGGDGGLLEEHRALLETMGATLFHVGGIGQGKVVKMVNQLMAATHLLAIGEAFGLGVRSGADPRTLKEVIGKSSGASKMMDLRLDGFLLDDQFDPGFRLDLMKKDVGLAVDAAAELEVPLFLGALVNQIFTSAGRAGMGDQDFAAAAKYLASLADASLAG